MLTSASPLEARIEGQRTVRSTLPQITVQLRCSIKCLYQITEEVGFLEQKTALYFALVVRGFIGLQFGEFGVMSIGDFLNLHFSKLKFTFGNQTGQTRSSKRRVKGSTWLTKFFCRLKKANLVIKELVEEKDDEK
ncbi:uncharacterized protein LOC110878280 isoform X2 [Helianthus annuus]|uniref:uncharacterized protein LOC110878280 isoform X2 n=1 Tax=Helianthus annuus TaxID=4232 RepID=UPI000B900CD6|nr:uncharacterized protein LOC110878280 isoform X2 [Helianthus annuus]